MNKESSIFIAGHRGMVGSACVRVFRAAGYGNLILRTRAELDLQNRAQVEAFYREAKPEYVVDAAARVGGIVANKTYPVEFLVENLEIQNNLIRGAFEGGVRKLLFLGSSCIYPKLAPQPIREDSLLTGPLEPTNEAYALAKIAGIRLCQAYARQYGACFISAMPTNMYGPGDNFDLESSHVLPALIRRFHEAKEAGAPSLALWGTGAPRREFLYSDDLAEACLLLLREYENPAEIVNVGYGDDVTVRELAETVAKLVGYAGRIEWDASRPDGTPRKLLDSARIRALGWTPRVSLKEGIAKAYALWRAQDQG